MIAIETIHIGVGIFDIEVCDLCHFDICTVYIRLGSTIGYG